MRRLADRVAQVERGASIAVLTAMVLLVLVEAAGRATVGHGIAGSIVLVQHLTLWVAMLGAALAARSGQLLALSTPQFLPASVRGPLRIAVALVGVAVTTSLCAASVDLIRIEGASGDAGSAGSTVAWGVPVWIALTVLPFGFGAIAVRLAWHASEVWPGRLCAALGVAIAAAFGLLPAQVAGALVTPALLIILAATVFGLPIFAAVGGATMLLFWGDGTPVNAVPGEAYRLTTSPMLAAVPLFALGGYLLAESRASRRLMRLFTAFFGWMPGGLAIVTTGVLAFFTPLTGASGITILSMGGLLLPVLVGARYTERTSIGLVTVSGSIGLLFFPSLPVFLYGFYAAVPIERLFVGALVPGVLLVAVVAGWAAWSGWSTGARRTPFRWREAAGASWEAKWELLLPVVVLGSIVTGTATLVEAAALAVLYTTCVACLVHRDLGVVRDLPRVTVECATLLGGFLIILSVALGFTNYLVIAEVPDRVLEWAHARIASPLVFLLALNGFLLVVGALMDIYSAIVVVVPLVLPMALAYGIDPVHLAVIFLANMELGYLMPPMGENLFLSSYRFNRPLLQIYRCTWPYTVILGLAVLLITYVPSLTLWLVGWSERAGYLSPL